MSHESPARDSPTILLVDDEHSITQVMTILLEDEGYRVTAVADGYEALEYLAVNKPDLIVTDYMMPELDGVNLIRQLRQNASLDGIPILLMSAAPLLGDAANHQADRYLKKGTDLEVILVTVRELLRQPRMSHE